MFKLFKHMLVVGIELDSSQIQVGIFSQYKNKTGLETGFVVSTDLHILYSNRLVTRKEIKCEGRQDF